MKVRKEIEACCLPEGSIDGLDDCVEYQSEIDAWLKTLDLARFNEEVRAPLDDVGPGPHERKFPDMLADIDLADALVLFDLLSQRPEFAERLADMFGVGTRIRTLMIYTVALDVGLCQEVCQALMAGIGKAAEQCQLSNLSDEERKYLPEGLYLLGLQAGRPEEALELVERIGLEPFKGRIENGVMIRESHPMP